MAEKKEGISIHKVFTSLEQAGNWLKGFKKLVKDRAGMENFPITTASPPERVRFLLYGISLLEPKNYPVDQREKVMMLKNLLKAETKGYPIEWIAHMSRCSLETAKKWREEAICMVKDAINDRIKHSLPIVGMN